MAKYLVLTEVKTQKGNAEWWMDKTDSKIGIEIKDSFDEARDFMRSTISKLAEKCDFFPFEEGCFEPLYEYEEEIEGVAELGKIVSNVIEDPNYFCPDAAKFNIEETDDGDWTFAFVANKDMILADCECVTLKFNVHSMDDCDKEYYFKYTECNEDDGSTVNAISVRMFNMEKANINKIN